MRVLVIGFARTGTMSLRAALAELGIGPTYHMMSWYTNPKDGKFWRQAINAKFSENPDTTSLTREEWDHVLGDCQAAIDAPTAAFMPELIRAYPEAKVIVSERDAEKWLVSYRQTIRRTAGDWFLANFIAPLDTYFLRDHAVLVRHLFQSVLHGKYESVTSCKEDESFEHEDEDVALKRRYRTLHDEVRQLVAPENLLEWRLEDGWKSLCAFLEVDCPNSSFPHINDTATFQRRQYLRKWLAADRIIISHLQIIAIVLLLALLLRLVLVQ
jgi:hypothetical protein